LAVGPAIVDEHHHRRRDLAGTGARRSPNPTPTQLQPSGDHLARAQDQRAGFGKTGSGHIFATNSTKEHEMTTITADDIRVLARSEHADAVLAVVDGEMAVVPALETDDDKIVYTRQSLLAEYGDEITDVDAEVLAAGLTARTTNG
jgi:hypothetical protein